MKYLLALLACLVPVEAFACDGGERHVGPVCVIPKEASTPGRTWRYSIVYFDGDKSKTTVWEDSGYVEAATKTKLTVFVMGDPEPVIYHWNAKKHRYVE